MMGRTLLGATEEAYVASYRRTMKWAIAEMDVALKAFGQELRKGLPRFVRRWFS